MSEKHKYIKIDNWVPKKNQEFVDYDNKLLTCRFEKILGSQNLAVYDKFMVRRNIYTAQLPLISRYINYFMNVFDTDGELAIAYLKIKFMLDKRKKFTMENLSSFIDYLYEVIFTPTIVKKIIEMVEYNYETDIENNNSQKKYRKNNKKHLESLEFTNQHVKILMEISTSIKIMAPNILHFFALNDIKVNKLEMDDILFKFYYRLFDIFGYDTTYRLIENDVILDDEITQETIDNELAEGIIFEVPSPDNMRHWYVFTDNADKHYELNPINMYNKLYVYTKAKAVECNSNNQLMFAQREIFGDDLYTVIDDLTKRVLIAENMFKYTLGKTANVIGFNKVIIRFQLNCYLKQKYEKTPTEVTNTKNGDGISGIDKMTMNLTKLDEGQITLVDINIEKTIERIQKQIDIEVTEEEIDYYREHMKISKLQKELVYNYLAKYFGAVRDLNLITDRQYIRLALLLKKKLLISGSVYESVLPYILTGNSEDRVNTRLIRNHRFISKIEESASYQKLMENKYKYLNEVKPDYIMGLLSTLINTRFSYVAYENPELLGKEIEYSEDKISDELLNFLNGI